MLLSLLWKAKEGAITLSADPLPWLFWIFFLFTFGSVLWSANPMPATVRSVSILFDVMGATLIWIGLSNGVTLRWLAGCAAAGAAVQAGIALYQFWTSGSLRVEGLVGNANELAIQLSLTAFLLLMVWGKNWLAGAFALTLLIVATVTSGSRKMVFVWFTYLMLLSRWLTVGIKRSTLVAAVVLLIFPASILVLIDNRDAWLEPIENLTVYQRLNRAIAGDDSSADKRENLLSDAMEVWATSPVWGHGIDQYRYMNPLQVYSHNNFTEVLANLGLIGLLLFYSIHANLFWRALALGRRGQGKGWLVAAFVVMLLMLDLARVSHTDRLTWLFLALVGFVCYRLEHGPPDPEEEAAEGDVARHAR